MLTHWCYCIRALSHRYILREKRWIQSRLCAHKCHSISRRPGWVMGLLIDTWICGLRMRRQCRGRFPRHRLQRKLPVSDPGMHHGACVKHVPWCMSGSLKFGGGENVPGIPGACATLDITYLTRGPCMECHCECLGENWTCYKEVLLHHGLCSRLRAGRHGGGARDL